MVFSYSTMKNKVILRLTREILLAFHIDKRAATLALEGEVFVSAGKINELLFP